MNFSQETKNLTQLAKELRDLNKDLTTYESLKLATDIIGNYHAECEYLVSKNNTLVLETILNIIRTELKKDNNLLLEKLKALKVVSEIESFNNFLIPDKTKKI